MEKIITMPLNLSYDYYTYNYLAHLQNEICTCAEDEIILDFSKCEFSHAVFTSFIGSLIVWAMQKKKTLKYQLSKKSNLYNYFQRSGLYNYITGDHVEYTNGNAIPFREIKAKDDEIIDYIDNILSLAPVKLSDKAEAALFQSIYEIFCNSVEHSQSKHGIYACGHWMPPKKELAFSVYDTGIGIPSLIKEKINADFSSKDALVWSLTPGHSTKQLIEGTPRGLGLSALKQFIKLNHGSFSIVSNDIYYNYTKDDIYKTIPIPILGTIISFIIRNDKTHTYVIK